MNQEEQGMAIVIDPGGSDAVRINPNLVGQQSQGAGGEPMEGAGGEPIQSADE